MSDYAVNQHFVFDRLPAHHFDQGPLAPKSRLIPVGGLDVGMVLEVQICQFGLSNLACQQQVSATIVHTWTHRLKF